MSIVSRYNDYINVFAPKRNGKAVVASPNIDEVDVMISTDASVRQVSSKYKSSVPPPLFNSERVPLQFLVSGDYPKIYNNEAVMTKLANGAEIDMNKPREPSKEIRDLYDKILNKPALTAFNGVAINLPCGDIYR